MNKNIFMVALLSIVSQSAYSGLIMTNYVNSEEFPVKITVPYYKNEHSQSQPLEITLDPGEIYMPKKNSNGYVYPGLDKIPDPVIEKMPVDDDPSVFMDIHGYEKDFLLSGETWTNMPKKWISNSVSEYKDINRCLQSYIAETNKTLIIMSMMKRAYGITNSYGADLNLLNDPKADLDGDGLDNLEELRCGTNPLRYDRLYLKPAVIKVEPGDSPIVTSVFEIVNNSSTNYHVFFRIWEDRHNKKLYQPGPWQSRLLDMKSGKTVDYDPHYQMLHISVAPHEKYPCAFLALRDALPRYFDLKISCSAYEGDSFDPETVMLSELGKIKNKFDNNDPRDVLASYGEITPIVWNYKCPPPSKPIIIEPPNNSCFTNIIGKVFRWEDNRKFWHACDGSNAAYKVESIKYRSGKKSANAYGFLDLQTEFSAICDYENDQYYHTPGIFMWRVKKITKSGAVSYSDWQKFSLGKEVGPKDDRKIRLKHKVVKHVLHIGVGWERSCSFWDCILDFGESGHEPYKVSALEPLPNGITLSEGPDEKYFTKSLHWNMPEGSEGTYTNHFVITDGETSLTNTHISVVVPESRLWY